jgi:hypothetical protein
VYTFIWYIFCLVLSLKKILCSKIMWVLAFGPADLPPQPPTHTTRQNLLTCQYGIYLGWHAPPSKHMDQPSTSSRFSSQKNSSWFFLSYFHFLCSYFSSFLLFWILLLSLNLKMVHVMEKCSCFFKIIMVMKIFMKF